MSLLDTASLIVTPNAVKEGKLYSVIPSDGSGDMSVTRATTATRVNSAGLVELVPYNLLTYSQDFSNAAWISGGGTITSNAAIAPNGTMTADEFASGVYCLQGSVQGVSTASAYFKKTTSNIAYIRMDSVSSIYIEFNINTGVVSSVPSGYTATIEDAGNGWYRCSATATSPSSNNIVLFIGPCLIWGAQLVEGSTAKDYQKTETRLNIPRLDYSNGTCPSLLVEPQRTNVLNYSEDFANATWTKAFGSLTSNAITSPSGTLTADKFIEDTTNVEHYLEQSFTSIASTTYAFSLYAKAAERSRIVIQLLSVSSPFENVYIEANLVSGTLVVQQAYNGATFVGATIEELPNGWYRITGAGSIGAKTNMRMRIYIANDLGQITYLGNGTSGLYVWGAQLEAGSYATSYIPTTSASVTRNADVISKTGISSLIGQTEGTIFIDTYIEDISAQTNDPVLFYIKGVAESYIEITPTGRVYGVFYNGTTSTGFINANIGLQNGRHKMAFCYKDNDFVLYVDGVQVGTDTSGIVSGSLTEFGLQYYQNFYVGTQEVNAAALWKTRLTNDQLEALTGIGFNTYAEMAEYYNYVLQ